MIEPFLAVTDKQWFDFLSSRSTNGAVDEVNFWSPSAQLPIKNMAPGVPVFFRLKHPFNAIAGYAFFAHFSVVGLDVAWDLFGWKNGDPDEERFLRRIGNYRKVDLLADRGDHQKLGCNVLRAAQFWPAERWIPWGGEQGWSANIVRGKTENDPARATRLLAEMQATDQLIPDLAPERFEPLTIDERTLRTASQIVRKVSPHTVST